ncbi:MAG: hypothetical protein Q4A92_00620 [Corynebacterium sp.]|nr:hypothetical protein [Corynebacterium sp.]
MKTPSAREIDKLIHAVADLNEGTLREFTATKKFLADVAESVQYFSTTEQSNDDITVLITRLIDAQAGALIDLERRVKLLETLRPQNSSQE